MKDFTAEYLNMAVSHEFDRWRSTLSKEKKSKAILLAGQPGAGKTVLSSYFMSRLNGNVISINGDEYRRYHPEYKNIQAEQLDDMVKLTAPFSAAFVEAMIEKTSQCGFNIVIEGTGRTVEVPKNTAGLLYARGYDVELAVIATRPLSSLISTVRRMYEMIDRGTVPRATAILDHDYIVEVLPRNLDELCNVREICRITIWTRELESLYDSSEGKERPSDALLGYWNSELSRKETCELIREIKYLEEKKNIAMGGQEAAFKLIRQRAGKIYEYCEIDTERLPNRFWEYYDRFRRKEISMEEYARQSVIDRVTLEKYVMAVESEYVGNDLKKEY